MVDPNQMPRDMLVRDDPNILFLYAARTARGFGDGFAVILLPAYLGAIGFTPVEIGFSRSACSSRGRRGRRWTCRRAPPT
jgi:hypothetical protein